MTNFTLTMNNAPSLLKENEARDGFSLITIATNGMRFYRITQINISNQQIVLYYNFNVDLTSSKNGDVVVVNIPYRSMSFNPNVDVTSETISHPNSQTGENFAGFIYKLYYINNNQANPADIDFNAIYNVYIPLDLTTKLVKFIYYSVINDVPLYSGVYGDVAYSGQYNDVIPFQNGAKALSYYTQTYLGIFYVFVNITNTPNYIIKSGSSTSNYTEDRYSDNLYDYVLFGQNVTLKGNICTLYWIVKQGDNILKNLSTFDIIKTGNANIINIIENNTSGVHVVKIDTNSEIDFRLAVKAK